MINSIISFIKFLAKLLELMETYHDKKSTAADNEIVKAQAKRNSIEREAQERLKRTLAAAKETEEQEVAKASTKVAQAVSEKRKARNALIKINQL